MKAERITVIKMLYRILSMLLFAFTCSIKANGQQEYSRTIIKDGIRVAVSVSPVNALNRGHGFMEGENVRFRFKISDTVSGKGLSGVSLAAWMDKESGVQKTDCDTKIKSYLEGGFLIRPEIDLNIYYVLTLNGDNTINVVNPLFGFGGSKLYTQIQLPAPGYDWIIKENQGTVYVSMPSANQVAFINTDEMKITENITLPGQPGKLQLQADEQYLWVTYDQPEKPGNGSGVVVIDTEKKKIIKVIPTAKGPHDIIVDEISKQVFISNLYGGTVSVIDMKTLEMVKSIDLKDSPLSMALSVKSRALYVVNKNNPVISVIDIKSLGIVKKIISETGIKKIYFRPGGRNGFVINPEKNTISIIDAASNRIVQIADVENHPDEISFTDNIAFVRHLGTEIISMIPLEGIGREGVPVSVAEFNGGQNPPALESPACGASGIVQAPGNAILICNYKDESVYYYQEGMAASMGSFNTYGKKPKAVMVVDRSIKEKKEGEYETIAKLGSSGAYDLALFMNVPLIKECFQINVLPDSLKEIERIQSVLGPLAVNYLSSNNRPRIGEKVNFRFQMIDYITNKPVSGLKDIHLMDVMTTKNKHHWTTATETEEKGTYKSDIQFDEEGLYYLYIECQSRGLTYNNSQFLVIYAGKEEKTK